MVGRYCSYLLPKQSVGTNQILIFKTLLMIGRPALYLGGLGNGMKVTPGFEYLESELHSPQEQCSTIVNYRCKNNNVGHFANENHLKTTCQLTLF